MSETYAEWPSQHYQVRLEHFQGPFDLLLHLIEKNEVDVQEIPVAVIADQYRQYLEENAFDLDLSSAFTVMLSRLMAMKAKSLLPQEQTIDGGEESGEEMQQQLVEQLLAYKQYKEAAQLLAGWEEYWQTQVPRPVRELPEIDREPEAQDPGNLNLENIVKALHAVWSEKPVALQEIRRPAVTLEQRTAGLRIFLENIRRIDLGDLLVKESTRREVILAFLAVLELFRRGIILLEPQDETGERFLITYREEKGDGGTSRES